MPPSKPRLSVTFFAYFLACQQFQARACGMELAEAGFITQVAQPVKDSSWELYSYYRCVVHSPEFYAAAGRVERTAQSWGGSLDGWEYPQAGDPEVDLPGEWECVDTYPIETIVAKSGLTYRVKIEPLYESQTQF